MTKVPNTGSLTPSRGAQETGQVKTKGLIVVLKGS